ncbi:MAG: phosphoribosylglycinamide formyltransferase [Bacteroidota bacterium]|jgi:phosphoribosylglycinamide formyltransferase-1
MKRIAIFASGTGSNAQKILSHFKTSNKIEVALIVSNKTNAGVLNFAKEYSVPTLIIDREKFLKGDGYVPELQAAKIDWIILAGFLWKIPVSLLNHWEKRIINIHPALLPKYGGKGMYGEAVHRAVLAANEKESGITIHYVDEQYDHGATIFQATCSVLSTDLVENLAEKIHALEHLHYPVVIEKVILSQAD